MEWYGPLIDLSGASSHVDGYVQLIVFIHRSTPVQYKLAKGGTVIRTDIQVGDETRPFFSVSLWNKIIASSISAGDIILLQNVKVTKFGNIIEARTVQYSSLLRLIHPYDSLLNKGIDKLMDSCRIGGTAKEKLRRVIEWLQRTRYTTLCNELKGDQKPALRNWKAHQEQTSRTCSLLSEVLQLDKDNPCKVTFHASIGEIFLPSAWDDIEKERMFISRRLTTRADSLVEDMICTGCQLCGSPLCSDSTGEKIAGPLYCTRSSNRLHTVGLVYRPFMLYVWDNSDYIPLLVTNKAAEVLFGNIRAEKVHQSYKGQKNNQSQRNLSEMAANVHEHKTVEEESCSSVRAMRSEMRGKSHAVKSPSFSVIWLIMLKMLLLQAKNSPLKFEAFVNPSLEMEDGRFEMICVSMPYLNSHVPSET